MHLTKTIILCSYVLIFLGISACNNEYFAAPPHPEEQIPENVFIDTLNVAECQYAQGTCLIEWELQKEQDGNLYYNVYASSYPDPFYTGCRVNPSLITDKEYQLHINQIENSCSTVDFQENEATIFVQIQVIYGQDRAMLSQILALDITAFN
jgi:hypothetical protein